MKETYEPIELDIREFSEEDVITVSEIDEEIALMRAHDNSYQDWSSFM